MQRGGVGEALGYSGHTGPSAGTSERSESESEEGAVEPRDNEVEKVREIGLSGASESSLSVSQRGLFEWRLATARVVLACAYSCGVWVAVVDGPEDGEAVD